MSLESTHRTAIDSILSGYLNAEVDDLDSLAHWCQNTPPKAPHAMEFKEQLRSAINNPGEISPKTYLKWTCDDQYGTQAEVQNRLTEIWNACFPAEAIR